MDTVSPPFGEKAMCLGQTGNKCRKLFYFLLNLSVHSLVMCMWPC